MSARIYAWMWGIALILTMVRPLSAQQLPATKPDVDKAVDTKLFERDNLVAWCIVPFDAKQRTPAQRAAMLEKLGFMQFAYDWRAEHIPTFDDEVRELQKRKIALSAFWFPAGLNDEAKAILALIKRHDVRTQLWITMGDPAPSSQDQAEKVAAAVRVLLPIAQEAEKLKCTVGLYNHGGWFGEAENQVAIIKAMKQPNVGIIYNLHHGHDHLDRLPELLRTAKPYLYAVNLNGMVKQGDQRGQKILQLGQGEDDLKILRTIVESGYRGPIGILGHTQDDAEARLQDNLDGLAWLVEQLQGKPAPPRPTPRTPVPALTPIKQTGAAASAFPGWLVAGSKQYRTAPLTVEGKAKFTQRAGYNILIACDEKRSGEHWELFSLAGSGVFTAYLPGHTPDHVQSEAVIADGEWHELAMQYEPQRVRLFVDGEQVAEQAIKRNANSAVPGDLAIGRLVEGGIGSEGEIAWARLSTGLREIHLQGEQAPQVEKDDKQTVGLWVLKSGHDAEDASSLKAKAKAVVSAATNAAEHAAAVVQEATPLPETSLAYDPQIVIDLVAEAQQRGNAERGRVVFRSAKFACVSCHAVGPQGGAVGPELSKIAQTLKPEQIAEAVLWPKRQVKPEYVAWQFALSDGRTLQAYKGQEVEGKIELREVPVGKLHAIALDDIEDQRETGTLMPDGLAMTMTPTERRDLLRFLCELGSNPVWMEKWPDDQERHYHVAKFAYDPRPLRTQDWPYWQLPVNRDRLYDFYAKEAAHFRQQSPRPTLLPAYPGLDNGKFGHWGNQNEETWRDGRWNQTDLGTLLSGVFTAPGVTVNKGVCIRLGDKGELAACFDPETLSYPVVWKGGFVGFSDVRHGFIDMLRPVGEIIAEAKTAPVREDFVYHGYYRHGRRVVFAYRLNGVELLDAPWVEEGKFVRVVSPRDEHPLRDVLKGGTPQWPQRFATKARLGTARPYAIDTIDLPTDNPWKVLLFCGDHDFLPDGSALVCTMQGDVWRVTGLNDKLDNVQWRRFASGLHQALGLVVHESKIYVLGRDQITQLHDLNSDGEADFYQCFSNKFVTSPAGHDYTCGLARDPQGRFYTASGKQGLIRISADGQQMDVLATGFRNPDGLGLLPDGSVTVPCSEGEWTPASMLCLVEPQKAAAPPHFGYGGPQQGKVPATPFAYLPRGLDNSSGGQVVVPDDRFGPLAGQILHFSFGQASHALVLRDEVQGQAQGAVVPLRGEFHSGAHRGRFSPHDGQLYVSGMNGWGSYAAADGAFERVRYTGERVQLPKAFHLHENGVLLSFTQPMEAKQLGSVQQQFAQAWNYRYSSGYGSPEFSAMHPGAVGHDALEITAVHLIKPDTIFVEIPDLQPVNQLHLSLVIDDAAPQELFITVNRLDKPFTALPNYRHVAKIIAAHPLTRDMAALGKKLPNPWAKELAGARRMDVQADKNLTFAPRQLTAKAGETLQLTFTNPDVVPHNWVLVKPGSLQRIGDLTNKLIADPDAVQRQYVPRSDEVIAYTDIVPPGQPFSIYFTAPQQPGRYPYLCTFPGHWMVMNGELVVE